MDQKDESSQARPCPNCGEPVKAEALACPSCGVNVRTGETYESRVERAKVKDLHAEHFHRGVYTGVTVLFAIIVVGGFLYQRPLDKMLRSNPGEFMTHTFESMDGRRMHMLEALGEVEALLSAVRLNRAPEKAEMVRRITEELEDVAEKRVEGIDNETKRLLRREEGVSWKQRSDFGTQKRLLRNVIKKAQFHRSRLPDTA